MGGADELHSPFGDGPRSYGFQLASDLINHDHFRVMVFNGLDHDLVLQAWFANLHPTRASDSRMRHITVAGDLVRGVNNDHAFLIGQDAGRLAQHRGLADSRPAKQQQAFAVADQVLNDFDRAVDCPTHPTRQTDDATVPVADG